jgi:hypothetical protein
MALRTGHGNGAGSRGSKYSRPTSFPRVRPQAPVLVARPDRVEAGRFARGNSIASNLTPQEDGRSNPGGAIWRPARSLASVSRANALPDRPRVARVSVETDAVQAGDVQDTAASDAGSLEAVEAAPGVPPTVVVAGGACASHGRARRPTHPGRRGTMPQAIVFDVTGLVGYIGWGIGPTVAASRVVTRGKCREDEHGNARKRGHPVKGSCAPSQSHPTATQRCVKFDHCQ